MVVLVDRWSSHRGVIVSLRLSMEQPTVVAIYRQLVFVCKWSLGQVSLYSSYCLTTIAQTGRADTHLVSCDWSTTGSVGVCGPAEQDVPLRERGPSQAKAA